MARLDHPEDDPAPPAGHARLVLGDPDLHRELRARGFTEDAARALADGYFETGPPDLRLVR